MFVEFDKAEVERSVPQRFERIVQLQPNRPAVKAGQRSFSYIELNRIANRIARAILATRGDPAAPIALLFEHGIDVIAAIMGTLKAGKFYVAVDPSLPSERIAYMLEDSQASLIVTNTLNADLAHKLAVDARPCLNIEGIDEPVCAEDAGVFAASDEILTIRYTSGSTGDPKGVVETHRNVLQSTILHAGEMRTCVDDRLSLLHSVTFASAYVNLFQALLTGASLSVFDIKSEGAHRLAKWLREERITVYHSPPAVFRQMADSLSGEEKLSSLRLIHLSGAPITRRDFELYKRYFCPGALLEIGMGSTEARGICSAFVDESFSFPAEGSPVGYPRPGKKILLLDENGREVRPGELGEIAVKGRNLNPGYWRRSELMRAKFSQDGSADEERLYLTGDLGRMMPDGFLVHLGRKDFQVKIRGYRVETVEIEKELLLHPHVGEVIVVARDREPGEKVLVAYVVPARHPPPATNELYDFLRAKLPHYMLPSAFVFLEAIPLTNGKLDRSALPEPGHARPGMSRPYVAARNEAEKTLVRIWEEVLGVAPIGIHDNFFDLGGHSLSASRFLSRLYDEANVELPLRAVFDVPTVAGLAECLDTAARGGIGRAERIVPVPRAGDLPLSFSQERLWFLGQLQPASCAYNLCSAFRLVGELDVEALERSLREIVSRHEVLRTVFKSTHGRPVQIVLPSASIDVRVADLRAMSSQAEREAEIHRCSHEEAFRPFDLSEEPLLRAKLLRLAEREHVLLLTIHHIVFDGWSMAVLARELSALYADFSSGRPSSLANLSVQYADFAVWQRDRLSGALLEEQLTYWKTRLDNLPTLRLPADRPRPHGPTVHGARRSFALSEALVSALRRASSGHGVTLFMTLLAAYQVLLHRYSGQDDIVIGSPVAGRSRSEVDGLIGFFLNMLVLRADLSGDPTFRELLARTRETCLGAYEHQELPFEKLVQELDPQRRLDQNPLFQVTFALQNNPACPLELAGLTVEDMDIGSGLAAFDLHLFIVEEESEARGWLVYKTDLFEASTVERWVAHFQKILEAIAFNPEQRLSEISLLADAERRQLLLEWNDTKKDYPSDRPIHELFEAQVERSFEATAVVFRGDRLTYGELNARANRLAHYLRKLGVGPETLVGLGIERSLEMVVGIIGVLKAGGAYLPLDPSYPEERLDFMLTDAGVNVVLTQQKLLEQWPRASKALLSRVEGSKIKNRKVVRLDTDGFAIMQESTENPKSEATANNLAYVMYTSGSTGTPKGVEVVHRGIVRLVVGVEYATLDAGRAFLQLAPISFDASTFEIWGALLHGARCVLFPGSSVSPKELGEVIDKHRISTLWLTASLFNAVIDQAPEALSAVRQLLIGGEALSVPHVRKALSLLPRTEIINGYGPTEGTTFTCCYSIPRTLDASANSIPIGRPIANTEVYLLDHHLSPVPIGVAGELYIGGDGLGRGYLNGPELTAEKFIPHPFSSGPGARLYKTGDLARYLPDGNIEFLGRGDHQVKIRGYRIEPGEIESVLRAQPHIKEALVLARPDVTGDKRLVGYVVSDDPIDIGGLRNFLAHKLPDYMIPSAFVFLDSLPLTSYGKVDRRALPGPDQHRPPLKEGFIAPRTDTEKTIAAIWREVLQLKEVGIHDDFFDLGGHSLLATQVISRISDALEVALPLGTLFENPTVAALAGQVALKKAAPERTVEIIAQVESLSEPEAKLLLTSLNPLAGSSGADTDEDE
jgi:amino acid adenylation domain-containing protein